jgi:transposase-like protein
MRGNRPAIFRGRHFEPEIIATCVRWYLRRKAEMHDHHLAYGRNLRSDCRTVGVFVPCSGQSWRHGGLLFVGIRDREAAKIFLQKALSNPGNRTPRVLCMDRCRIYPAAIRDLRAEGRLPQRCRRRTKRYANNRIESDHRHVKRRLRAMQGPRTIPTAHRVIQGIEVLGSKRMNPATTSIAFSFLLKIA